MTLIENHANLGVVTALNQGLEEAAKQGFEWMITFDQDSEPGLDFVDQFYSALVSYVKHNNLAIIAPKIIDTHLGKESFFLKKRFPFVYERIAYRGVQVEDVTYVKISAAMINPQVASEISGFRGDLFIGYVATELCL